MLVKLEFFSGEFVFLLERLKQRVNGGRNAHKWAQLSKVTKKYS
jgi:hypothetical protein